MLQDVRSGAPLWQPQLVLLVALNIGYATFSWIAPRLGYGRTGRVDLVNLPHNAVKFTERGRIGLNVIVLEESDDALGAGAMRVGRRRVVTSAPRLVRHKYLS